MKKNEAISILATSARPREPKDRTRYDEAVKIAISALTAQDEKRTDKRTETHVCDSVSRQAAIDLVEGLESARLKGEIDLLYPKVVKGLIGLPSAQPDVSEALSILDAIRAGGRIKYSDYCELHDAIAEIGE